MSTIFHLRIKQPRQYGKPGYSAAHFARVTGNYGPEPRTTCGAACTDIDVSSPRDLREWESKERGLMTPCPECLTASKR